jgi:hypothetical protein
MKGLRRNGRCAALAASSAMLIWWSTSAPLLARLGVAVFAAIGVGAGVMLRAWRQPPGVPADAATQEVSVEVAALFDVAPVPVRSVAHHGGGASLEGIWPRRHYLLVDDALARSPQSCRAVIGHEYGHLVHPRQRWRLLSPLPEMLPFVLVVAGVGGPAGAAGGALLSLVGSWWHAARRRREELDADASAVIALGSGVVDDLVMLFSSSAKAGWLSSHPSDRQRCEALTSGFGVRQSAFRNRCGAGGGAGRGRHG